ncbi:MAG: hypothetical protein B7733_12995 [Myxococcales bacterium FL481]|nr:MAG: hypothetical protein B7733_12995 [Myxococcales bacterium FL481]
MQQTHTVSRRLAGAVILCAVAAVHISHNAGCALFDRDATPQAQYASLQDAFIAAQTAALIAHRTGQIDPADWEVTWKPLLDAGDRILDDMEAALAAGEDIDLQRVALRSILTQLREVENGS